MLAHAAALSSAKRPLFLPGLWRISYNVFKNMQSQPTLSVTDRHPKHVIAITLPGQDNVTEYTLIFVSTGHEYKAMVL